MLTTEFLLGALLMIVGLGISYIALAITGRLPRTLPDRARLEQDVRDLTATVNTLRRQLDESDRRQAESDRRIIVLEAENSALLKRVAELEVKQQTAPEKVLLIVVSDELDFDTNALNNLQGIQTKPIPPKIEELKRALERARRLRRGITLVHMSVYIDGSNIKLDRSVAAAELNALLGGVQVLVLLGDKSVGVADLLTSVTYTVAFREFVSYEESRTFSVLFWRAVADGLNIESAFKRALDLGPTGIGKYAELLTN